MLKDPAVLFPHPLLACPGQGAELLEDLGSENEPVSTLVQLRTSSSVYSSVQKLLAQSLGTGPEAA